MKQVALLTAVLLLALGAASQTTPEEHQIRKAFAKVELGWQIHLLENVIFQKTGAPGNPSPLKGPLSQYLQQNRLEFKLTNFRVGNIADSLNEPYRIFGTEPADTDALSLTNASFSSQTDHGVYEDFSVDVHWTEQPQSPLKLDDALLGQIIALAKTHDGIVITRFASYDITVKFQGRTRSRRATWWYGKDKNGNETIATNDFLASPSIVGFVKQPIYPGILLEDPERRNNPAVTQWLATVSQNCPGNLQDCCYDEATDKAGISEDDIERGTQRP